MDAAPAQPDAQATFSELLKHYGYAPAAVYAAMGAPIPAGVQSLRRILDNYYMQFLALQLERYHFALNRPLISADQLHLADNLIEGKHGNPKLDNLELIELLKAVGTTMAEHHAAEPLTWRSLYAYSYTATDGSTVYGRDLIRALLHSDATHQGAQVQPYHHAHAGHDFATYSMMQAMAETLALLSPKALERINRFGKPVSTASIDQAIAMKARYAKLRPPKLADYYNRNSHESIKDILEAIFLNLQGPCSLTELHAQHQQLERHYFNPGMYSPAWHRFMYDMDAALQLITTPYA